jgi:hypothetical protein
MCPSDDVLATFSVAEPASAFSMAEPARFFFFFSPFSGGLPRVNTRVFFPRPFPADCPGLILGFYYCFFSPFFRRAAQG